MTWIIIGLALGWAACGFIAYGIVFAYLQLEYRGIAREQYRSDRKFALFVAMIGPIGLFAVCVVCNCGLKHGLRWRSLP